MAKKKQVQKRAARIDGISRQISNPLARGANVRDYFITVLGRPVADDRFSELTELPCESECGAECVMVINAARTLLDHVERATGTDYPERNDMVLAVALHVVETYYFG